MAPGEPPEELALRIEREKRRTLSQREANLENSLAPFRVGSVPYLNAAPLTRGLEDQIVFVPPSELAVKLRRAELDAALVSVTEVLFTGRYDVLDGVSVASLGEVKSVLLAHREPLERIREVYCDPASLTSVSLLKVLLAERGLQPEFKTLPDYQAVNRLANVLLIGDRALDFIYAPHERSVFDLGAEWYERTGLPFVYAVWALRRDVDHGPLCRRLREAKDFGLETLDHIIRERKEYDFDFRKDYLGWHIHYHLGAEEKRGLVKFIDLLKKHGMGPVHEPRFVR